MNKLILLAALAVAAGSASAAPFQMNMGATFAQNLPVKMNRIVDYIDLSGSAIVKSNVACPGGVKVFMLKEGRTGSSEGCAVSMPGRQDLLTWKDGSSGLISKDEWEGFIPNYMK